MAPVLLYVGLGVGAGLVVSKMMDRGVSMPSMAAPGNVQATATPTATAMMSEQERKNKRLAASLLTKDWTTPPKLSKQGLLGW